jgi:hypothetical protein
VSVIRACPLPDGALLARYTNAGAYTDCYTADVAKPVALAEYLEAFYTGKVFRIERILLRLFLSKPSTDAEVRQLARGEAVQFSAWKVEARTADQLLLCDSWGRTRSWLMVAPTGQGEGGTTRLYFGSAVVPVTHATTGRRGMGFLFKALLGFHRIYSRILLGAAHAHLARQDK